MFHGLTALAFTGCLLAQSPSFDVAVGVFPFLVGNMDPRIPEIVGNCQTYGIDTLYVSSFRATGPSTGDLWITDSAVDWNPAWGPVRPGGAGINLQNLIAACHAANVRVVAVLKCFADTVQPDNAAHCQYLLDVVDYFVDAWLPNGQPVYDLDGIALDYVRYVGGTSVVAANVTNFVAAVRQHIGSLSLHAYLIANRYSFDGPTYDGVFNSYAATMNSLVTQFGQNWEHLAPYVDVFMPMAYTANGSIYNSYALHQAYVRKTAEYARTACTNAGLPGRRVCPTIRTYTGGGETTTDLTIEASITGALLGSGNGYQAFRYQFLVNNPTWWTKMAQFAVPGCNWPRPAFTTSSPTLTSSFDPSQTTDLDQPAATLDVRFDFENDRMFDTPWQPSATAADLARHPGQWVAAMQARDNTGHVSTTRRRFVAGSAVTLSPPYLSTTTGGSVQVQLDVGAAGAGNWYLAIASITGTTPGFEWYPGFPVALNIDAVTQLLASAPSGGILNNGFGQFDPLGRATAVFTLPPVILQWLAGLPVYWSFLSVTPGGLPACVGDTRTMLLTL
ncbi:MAG TPA: hypothetical protein VFD82_10020 [Planctomycetota bacterium]|nr:hypothetical protein [Planctomycetota bacterium]